MTERIEETISGYNASVVVNVYGNDLDALDQDGQNIARILESITGSKDITLQSPPGNPQVKIRLRPEIIAQLGIMNADILDTIRAAYEGYTASYIYEGINKKPVVVTFERKYREDIANIRKLPIRGVMIKLYAVLMLLTLTKKTEDPKFFIRMVSECKQSLPTSLIEILIHLIKN